MIRQCFTTSCTLAPKSLILRSSAGRPVDASEFKLLVLHYMHFLGTPQDVQQHTIYLKVFLLGGGGSTFVMFPEHRDKRTFNYPLSSSTRHPPGLICPSCD